MGNGSRRTKRAEFGDFVATCLRRLASAARKVRTCHEQSALFTYAQGAEGFSVSASGGRGSPGESWPPKAAAGPPGRPGSSPETSHTRDSEYEAAAGLSVEISTDIPVNDGSTRPSKSPIQASVLMATTDDPVDMGSQSFYNKPPDSTGGSKNLPVFPTQAGKRADIVSLRKHLDHARNLASAIKRGQSYFHLLQKEQQEERKVEVRRQMRREEQLRTEPRPPSFSSDSDSDSEGWPVPAGASWSGGIKARRHSKKKSARPFTPIHYSLTSPLLSEAPREVIYRQLCCLNWLLEALTLDRPGRVGPLTACWDPKDPGRGRTTIKTLKKERAVESKWEQFVSNKPCRVYPKRRRSSTVHLHAFRRGSFVSVASLSALTSTTVGSSLSSLVPGPEEDTGCPGAAEETERPSSEHVQQRVQRPQPSSAADGSKASESKKQPLFQRTDSPTGSKIASATQPKSRPAKAPSAVSRLISSKASRLQQLRAAFKERAEEVAESYINILELKARSGSPRERLNSGLQMYQALCHKTESHHAPHHVTYKSQETQAPNKKKNDSNNMWLSTLLSSLPEELCKERAVSRVMQKLSSFAEQQTIRVRPQLLLKVLGGLELWELCLPELCVAIQIAMDHVVQMSRAEYDAWLFSRVTLPP